MSDASTAVEIELKLTLPGSTAEKAVVDFLGQKKYSLKKIDPANIVDIYMDTSDWTLLKNKLSLRYRLADDKAVYTMKSTGPIEGGIARRDETEVALDKPPHAPTVIPVKELRNQVKDIISPRKLLEQIMVRTNRRRYLAVSPEGAKFEVSFDTSGFSANPLYKARRVPQLHQFEAELIDGKETAVEALASLLADKFAYPPATSSKMETAMKLLKVEPIVKVVPEHLKLRLDDRLDSALKKLLAVEFHWFLEQLPGAISDRDPEFVHQARVSIRRMRSVLMLFHNALDDKTATYFDARLKSLGRLFGEVRDLDVFIINLTGYKDKIESFPKAKRRALASLMVKQRRSPLKELNAGLESRRFKNFERSMLQFLESPTSDVPERPVAMKPISEVAPEAVSQGFDCVIQQSKKTLKAQGLADFHCLRIQMKRLRYTLEFMAPPYGEAFKDLIRGTIEIQDCLGELQDTVFNQQLIKRILKDWQGKTVDSELIFILGEIYQLQGEIARERKQTFNEIWQGFSSKQNIASLEETFRKQPVPRTVQKAAQTPASLRA